MYKLATLSSAKPIVDEIIAGEKLNAELITGIPYNFRVLLRDRKPPMTVSIRYQTQQGRIQIFGSFKSGPE